MYLCINVLINLLVIPEIRKTACVTSECLGEIEENISILMRSKHGNAAELMLAWDDKKCLYIGFEINWGKS